MVANEFDLLFSIFIVVFMIAFVAIMALVVWRVIATQKAASKLGLDGATTALLTVTDPDNAATTLVGTAALADRIESPGSVSLNDALADLRAAHGNGHISDQEYEELRQRALRRFAT